MFTRAMTDQVVEQQKTTVNAPLGQVETWTTVRTISANVVELSADQVSSWMGQRKQEGTQSIYAITVRALGRTWSFSATRFLWTPRDSAISGSGTRTLKPIKDILTPGKGARRWAKIICQDITDMGHSCD